MDSNLGFLPLTAVTHPGPATRTSELPRGRQSAARDMSMLVFCECNNHREKKGNKGNKTEEAPGTHGTSRWGWRIGVFHSSDRLEEAGHVAALG